MKKNSPTLSSERRKFLGAATATTFAAGAVGLEPLLNPAGASARASAVGTAMNTRRRARTGGR